VITDATADVERERATLETRETFTVFESVLADRRRFVEFMHEVSELIENVLDPNCKGSELARALHTLKGNALLVGLQSIAQSCHEFESDIAAGEQLNPATLVALSTRWNRLSGDVDSLLGGRSDVIELSLAQHAALQRAVRGLHSRDELARIVDGLAFEPLQRRLAYLADQTRRLAERLRKSATVEVQHDGTQLGGRPWPKLWAALVHALRNALDHGIEPPAERLAKGKPEMGHIDLHGRREALDIVLEIEDDGRGIDWEAIRRRCADLGLPSASPAELMEGHFMAGMSTAAEVTDISGRGVGMGALRSTVRALGGKLEVRSERGKGTRLRMAFPPQESPAVSVYRAVAGEASPAGSARTYGGAQSADEGA
jgi:two-component system, chemotaxis family, sensor kinase CheA